MPLDVWWKEIPPSDTLNGDTRISPKGTPVRRGNRRDEAADLIPIQAILSSLLIQQSTWTAKKLNVIEEGVVLPPELLARSSTLGANVTCWTLEIGIHYGLHPSMDDTITEVPNFSSSSFLHAWRIAGRSSSGVDLSMLGGLT